MQTLSGKSLGSLGQYSLDWNNADTGEVSSAPALPPLLNPALGANPALNPANPISIGQKMFTAKAALLDVDRAVEVTLLSLLMITSCVLCRVEHTYFAIFMLGVHHPQSPRFGLSNLLLGLNLNIEPSEH